MPALNMDLIFGFIMGAASVIFTWLAWSFVREGFGEPESVRRDRISFHNELVKMEKLMGQPSDIQGAGRAAPNPKKKRK